MNQCTDGTELDRLMAEGNVTAYAGFDATADSLHVGHLVVLVAVRRLVASGHRAIILLGGATSLVGDPSFRNSTRPVLSAEAVAANVAGIRRNIEGVLGEHADDVLFVDNRDWLEGARLIDFMRSVGTHFTAARMMSMESVKNRISDGLTMLELSYMLLQAADFVELSRRHGCLLQMGGSDQWGNIVNGIDLARRVDGKQLFGLTVPLLTTSDGRKMGKTADGAVWLSPDKLHPRDFWQFWRNMPDADTERLLLQLTELPADRIRNLCANPATINEAKILLADEVTSLVHGRNAAIASRSHAEALFRGGSGAMPLQIQSDGEQIGLLKMLVLAGFATSNSSARRLVESRAVKLDGAVVSDPRLSLQRGVPPFIVSVGKRRRTLVKVV